MKLLIEPGVLRSLLTMATVVEARDAYTGGHTWRVSRYGEVLARAAGLRDDEVFAVRVGGLVHDIGKVAIADSILNKPGPLTAIEFQAMREHPRLGRSIVAGHPLETMVLSAVGEHHERLDGRGYPDGREKEQVGLIGRIVAISDAFDAMTSTRPYRPGLPVVQARENLKSGEGSQFDPGLVKIFLGLLDGGELAHILGHANDMQLMLSCTQCGPIIAPASDISDGDQVQCPHCTGLYRVHTDGAGLVLEATQQMTGISLPRPDHDSIQAIMRSL